MVVAILLLGGFASYSRHELRSHQQRPSPIIKQQPIVNSAVVVKPSAVTVVMNAQDRAALAAKSNVNSLTSGKNNTLTSGVTPKINAPAEKEAGKPVPERELRQPVKVMPIPKPPQPPKVGAAGSMESSSANVTAVENTSKNSLPNSGQASGSSRAPVTKPSTPDSKGVHPEAGISSGASLNSLGSGNVTGSKVGTKKSPVLDSANNTDAVSGAVQKNVISNNKSVASMGNKPAGEQHPENGLSSGPSSVVQDSNTDLNTPPPLPASPAPEQNR